MTDLPWEFTYSSSFEAKDWLNIETEEMEGVSIFYRDARAEEAWVGKKIECIGYDAREAKNVPLRIKMMPIITKALGRPGWWIEVDSSVAQVLISNEQTPSYRYKDLLQLFPDITKFNLDGSYVRKIKGFNSTEYVFGDFVLKQQVKESIL